MGYRARGPITVAAWAAALSLLTMTGCALWSSPSSADTDPDNPVACSEDPDCLQPPLRRDELHDHLKDHQERILSRNDYKNDLPPPVSEIIYGPLPDGVHREGPAVTDATGQPYDGPLNWHHVEFDDVYTDTADHDSLRGRDVSGAHCLFARRPNRLTPLFAVLVLHHPHRGDSLYFGGPNQHVTRIDTVPVTDRRASRLRIDTEAGMHCVFRDDQNQFGAVVVPFEYADIQEPDDHRYAVYTITVGNRLYDTGRTKIVPRVAGLKGDEIVDVEVPLRKYPRPRIEFVETTGELHEAMVAAEDEITEGDFRLRPEFVYPRMPYQSYLNTGKREFCPTGVACQTPHRHLDKDTSPPTDTTREADGDAGGE